MIVFYADHHEVQLPEGHRFPMHKYRALREALVAEAVLRPDQLHASGLAPWEELALVHTPDYLHRLRTGTLARKEERLIGLPWSPTLIDRSRASVFGTVNAARAALAFGVAGNLAGGTHHAFADRGEGFCVFNDLAVAARALLAEGAVERVLILDLDVHHGNGTAQIFTDDPRVFTCSLHGERNYPYRKPPGDLDVGLPDEAGDDLYLDALTATLPVALDRARPDLILYQAGVDPLAEDRLGRLHLSHEGLRQRDHAVLDAARRMGIPVALSMGGGYSQPIDATLQAHLNTYRVARALFP